MADKHQFKVLLADGTYVDAPEDFYTESCLLFRDSIYYVTDKEMENYAKCDLPIYGTYNDYADNAGYSSPFQEADIDVCGDQVEVFAYGNTQKYKHRITHIEEGIITNYPLTPYLSTRSFKSQSTHLKIKHPYSVGVYQELEAKDLYSSLMHTTSLSDPNKIIIAVSA